jgi:hypothetical protein
MERHTPLLLKDIVDFEDLFNGILKDIHGKNVRGLSITEELVAGFQKLYQTIDQLLTRAGRKLLIAGNSSCSSLEHENI